tara:strand:+ start:374 stop:1288 length:915 start_codon:yes stop_codon:yes gene_type:complete
MRNLTATICPTIAVLLASAGVSWGQGIPNLSGLDYATRSSIKVETASAGNNNPLSPIRYSELSGLTYVDQDGATNVLSIDTSDPNITQFGGGWKVQHRLVGHFAVDLGNPYSPGHNNLTASVRSRDKRSKLFGFLEKSAGTKVQYKLTEEWNSSYSIDWKLEATILKRGVFDFNGQKIFGTEIVITGESVGYTSSSWHFSGVKFRENRIIDLQSKVTVALKREWENRTKMSPPKIETRKLVSIKLKSGKTASLSQLLARGEGNRQWKAKLERQRQQKVERTRQYLSEVARLKAEIKALRDALAR